MSRSGNGVETPRCVGCLRQCREKRGAAARNRNFCRDASTAPERTRSRAKRREPIPRVNVKVSDCRFAAVGGYPRGYGRSASAERRRTWRRHSTSILRPIALAAGDKPEMADVPPGAERGRSDDQSRGVTGHADFSDFNPRRHGALFRPRSARPLCARGAAELYAGARGSLAAAYAGRAGLPRSRSPCSSRSSPSLHSGPSSPRKCRSSGRRYRNTGTTSSRSCARSPGRYRCSASPRHFTRRPPTCGDPKRPPQSRRRRPRMPARPRPNRRHRSRSRLCSPS